jgi:hypothetical protein
MSQIKHPITTGLALILLGVVIMAVKPARGDDRLVPSIQLAPPPMELQPAEPSYEEKAAALLRAYRAAPVPRAIKTERIILPAPRPKAEEPPDLNMDDLRKFARRANYKTDICARHHMRKVATRNGKSWRCK